MTGSDRTAEQIPNALWRAFHILDREVSLDHISAMTDKDLSRVAIILDHWQQLAVNELQRRRTP